MLFLTLCIFSFIGILIFLFKREPQSYDMSVPRRYSKKKLKKIIRIVK